MSLAFPERSFEPERMDQEPLDEPSVARILAALEKVNLWLERPRRAAVARRTDEASSPVPGVDAMNTTNRIQIAGSFDRIFRLAADIARWPEFLPPVGEDGGGGLPPSRPSPTRGEGIKEWGSIQIHHHFDPKWPPPGPWLAQRIIGELFVKPIADKTLQRLKEIVESNLLY